MLIFLDDLRKQEWFSKLPEAFRNMGKNDCFTFYYEYDFENTKLKIRRSTILSSINIYLYGDIQTSEENLGYFKQPFNTKDTLFYYYLKTYIGDDAKKFILSYKAKDDELLKNETAKYKFGDIEIKDRITFQDAITKFVLKGNLINPIMTLTDSLNSYLLKNKNKSLYGQTIKKMVRLIKHSAEGKEKGSMVDLFLIPDEGGMVRYMMVGENSEVYKNSESLKIAKDMLRQKYSVEKIYNDTGWFFNTYDSKFRRNIEDVGFKIKKDLISYEKALFYYPDNCPIKIQDIYNYCVKSPQTNNWINYIKDGYNGRLGDAFYHPTLFKHYPELYNLPFYYVKKIGGSDGRGNYSYRYSPNTNDIVICGYSSSTESILLHEIQHAIQNIEGFATGGNDFLATMINGLGGGDVREYLILSPKLTNRFCESIADLNSEQILNIIDEGINKLKNIINTLTEKYYPKRTNTPYQNTISYAIGYAETIKVILSSAKALDNKKEELVKKCYSLCIHAVALHKYISQYNDIYLNTEYNYLINNTLSLSKDFDIIVKLSNTIYESDRVRDNLGKKGFAKNQVDMIVFQTYQNLFGEMEARTVQNIAYLEDDLRLYFLPYTSETLDFKSFSVILSDEEYVKERKIEAGIEKTNDDRYIIHLTPQLKVSPFIHELGHIVYDMFRDFGLDSFVNEAFVNGYLGKYINEDEFFCDYFSSYICKLGINEQLSNDLNEFKDMPSFPSIDFILNAFFNVHTDNETLMGIRYIEYLKKL